MNLRGVLLAVELAEFPAEMTDSPFIPESLRDLKPSEALDSLSMSQLARNGSAILRSLMETEGAVTVKVQGQGAMVTLSQRRYDELVALIRSLETPPESDRLTEALRSEFDALKSAMANEDASDTADKALFGGVDTLRKSYRPGETEAKS
ncbi:MAG: hypothetical protein AAF358_14185 [Pseudomonadota bacterium]